jgi:hypothetical protein
MTVSVKTASQAHECLKMAKKSVDEESTAEYCFFHQLDWPPERVPPLIELVYSFYDSIKELLVWGPR